MFLFSVMPWKRMWHSMKRSVYPWYGDTLETEMRVRRREAELQRVI